jgi:predicted alpha/beta hydrolase family esterase
MSDYRTTLIVPGLHGSGAAHWQTWWQQKDRSACRIELADWEKPDLDAWSNQVRAAVCGAQRDVWIVAHSFGCLASLHVAQEYSERISGLLLVAPADPDKFEVASRLPASLSVPSIFVASRTDPWLAFGKAQQWAENLGSRLVDLGDAGHINVESGFGAWQQGFDLFADFKREISATKLCAAMSLFHPRKRDIQFADNVC